jgi:hypothetical protein
MAHAWHRGERRSSHDIFRRQGAFCRDGPEGSGPAGKVGLWTKADSATWFESLKIESLD